MSSKPQRFCDHKEVLEHSFYKNKYLNKYQVLPSNSYYPKEHESRKILFHLGKAQSDRRDEAHCQACYIKCMQWKCVGNIINYQMVALQACLQESVMTAKISNFGLKKLTGVNFILIVWTF